MNARAPLRVLPALPEMLGGPPGRYGPDDCYGAAVWLPVLGPASFLMWVHLARRLGRQPTGVTTSVAELAIDLGLGSPNGSQATVQRTLRRLERFGLLGWVTDDLVVVRQRLAPVSPAQLCRLHPSVRARHHALAHRVTGQAC